MELTIIFPVLNEKKRLESGITRTVSYLQSIEYEDYEIGDVYEFKQHSGAFGVRFYVSE